MRPWRPAVNATGSRAGHASGGEPCGAASPTRHGLASALARIGRQECYEAGMEQPAEAASAGPLPWDLHPALTEDRLRVCARLLANARRDAFAMAAYEMGDDAWSVGCRAFSFGRQRVRRTAEAGIYNWLSVLDESQHFVFLIESVPVRFYRGAADDPSPRALRRQEAEAQQLSLALGADAAEGLVFRLALETDASGALERVVFLAMRDEDHTECFWPVPLDVTSAGGSPDAVQLRLLPDDGYAGPGRADASTAAIRSTGRLRTVRRLAASTRSRPRTLC